MSDSDDSDPCAASVTSDYDQSLAIGAVFIILAASLIGTMLPLIFKRFPSLLKWPFLVVIGKHIGTGVLLALSLIHLLDPAIDELEDPCLPQAWQDYSYAPLFALLAALAMHLIETSVLEYTIYSKQHAHGGGDQGHPGHGPLAVEMAQSPNGINKSLPAFTSSTSKLGDADKGEANMENGHTIIVNQCQTADARYQDPAALKAELQANAARTKIAEVHHTTNYGSTGVDQHHGHSHGVLLGNSANERTIGAYILEFGLTAHSVIVGITVGVAGKSDLETLIPALTFHQFFEGFALGARLASIGFNSFNEFLLTCIYSFSAPLGIAIGIGIANSYDGNSSTTLIVQGSFDSVSAGILLYVAFVQMLGLEFPADYKNCGSNMYKKLSLYCAMYVGAGVMALIGKWL